ncbi:terpenoid synthase [Lactarius psammicola]|nr:terpenoid synthase [Lactarius psammicola]
MRERYYLPKIMDTWHWPRNLNPNYPEVHVETLAWIRSFDAFSPKAQAAFDSGAFNHMPRSAHSWCTARVRTGCAFMNQVFVFDEFSDRGTEEEAQEMAIIVMDALRNPHTPRPKGEWIGGEVTRSFWELAIQTASPQSQKRFIKGYDAFSQAVVKQAANRGRKYIVTVQEYFEVRRDTIGSRPAFALIELDLNLPDEAVEHPVIEEMIVLATDMIVLSNDIASYNVEQARGDDGHNIITVIMHHQKTDIQSAMNWVYDYHKAAEERFMELYWNQIPKFGEPVDTDLARYVEGLGNWVRSNDQWNYESQRYFGKKAAEIQKHRWVTLLPKQDPECVGPLAVDDSLL